MAIKKKSLIKKYEKLDLIDLPYKSNKPKTVNITSTC